MPNPPKTRGFKVITGTDRKDRERPELELPKADGAPEPPDFLDIVGVREFNRVAALLLGAGVLTDADFGILSAYAAAWSGLVRRWGNGIHPNASDYNAFRALAGELGLSPSARARIPPGDKQKANRFSNNGKRGE